MLPLGHRPCPTPTSRQPPMPAALHVTLSTARQDRWNRGWDPQAPAPPVAPPVAPPRPSAWTAAPPGSPPTSGPRAGHVSVTHNQRGPPGGSPLRTPGSRVASLEKLSEGS